MITDDVGRLFAAMQANYGHRWPHRADAIPVWLHKLKGFSLPEVMRAADKAMDLLYRFGRPIRRFKKREWE